MPPTISPPAIPARVAVAEQSTPWDVVLPSYSPPDFTHPKVLAQYDDYGANGWADPPDWHAVDFGTRHSFSGPLRFDAQDRPLNPLGRVGLAGRGLLGRWGPNHAADPVVLKETPTGFALLTITRRDSGHLALPGGMVDAGEEIAVTLARELAEETGAQLDMAGAYQVFAGVVSDPRSTDHAWMESTARYRLLTAAQADALTLRAGDDAATVCWMDLDDANLAKLYGSHQRMVGNAMAHLAA